MRIARCGWLVVAVGLVGQPHCARSSPADLPIPAGSNLLARLRPGHPRLLVAGGADLDALRVRVHTLAPLKEWHARLRARGQQILREPAVRYEIPDGLRLLSVSRRVLDRVYTLALLHHLDGDAEYADRVWREASTAAVFKDWNPRHFLDTAEMTHAVAIAYDWLYASWSPLQRAALEQAIVDKGLQLAVDNYRGTAQYGGWPKARHNWNQVCNGGIGMGALALADVRPDLAAEFLEAALRSLQLPMAEYAPDGAWAEGPGYWNYATFYNVVFLAALQTALGTDCGLSDLPGFSETGMFPMAITGPTGRTFNYADGGDGAIRAPQMLWMATRFQRPAYARYQRSLAAPHALDLLGYDDALWQQPGLETPLDVHFQRADILTLRSQWEDPKAVFVGFKGGNNRVNHSHLDLGTFILEALGVRWGVDLGADNYNLPGYFGNRRWTYYRLRAEGHNTLVLNPGSAPDQDPAAAATILEFESGPHASFARADLTPAYARHATRVTRAVALLNRRMVLVEDRIAADLPAEAWWFFHTRAAIALGVDGTTAVLRQNDRRLGVAVLSPKTVRFLVRDATPLPSSPQPEQQDPNEGVRKLALSLPGITNLHLRVVFVPLGDTNAIPANPLEGIDLPRAFAR